MPTFIYCDLVRDGDNKGWLRDDGNDDDDESNVG